MLPTITLHGVASIELTKVRTFDGDPHCPKYAVRTLRVTDDTKAPYEIDLFGVEADDLDTQAERWSRLRIAELEAEVEYLRADRDQQQARAEMAEAALHDALKAQGVTK